MAVGKSITPVWQSNPSTACACAGHLTARGRRKTPSEAPCCPPTCWTHKRSVSRVLSRFVSSISLNTSFFHESQHSFPSAYPSSVWWRGAFSSLGRRCRSHPPRQARDKGDQTVQASPYTRPPPLARLNPPDAGRSSPARPLRCRAVPLSSLSLSPAHPPTVPLPRAPTRSFKKLCTGALSDFRRHAASMRGTRSQRSRRLSVPNPDVQRPPPPAWSTNTTPHHG